MGSKSRLSEEALEAIFERFCLSRPDHARRLLSGDFVNEDEYVSCAMAAQFYIGRDILEIDPALGRESSDVYQDLRERYLPAPWDGKSDD